MGTNRRQAIGREVARFNQGRGGQTEWGDTEASEIRYGGETRDGCDVRECREILGQGTDGGESAGLQERSFRMM